jgi:glycerol-3-phosphate acyltransferase PlsY
MQAPLPPAALCASAFLLGAIPFGFLAGWLKGVDLREHGSKNIGAANTTRILGKPMGFAVLALDALKGFVPIALAQAWRLPPEWIVAAGLCAILGHIYSPFVRFRGGKGVATTLGVLIGLSPLVAALSLSAFILTVAVTDYISVGSIVAALAQAALFWALPGFPLPVRILGIVVAAFVILRHRANIGRLRRGEENRFRQKKA